VDPPLGTTTDSVKHFLQFYFTFFRPARKTPRMLEVKPLLTLLAYHRDREVSSLSGIAVRHSKGFGSAHGDSGNQRRNERL